MRVGVARCLPVQLRRRDEFPGAPQRERVGIGHSERLLRCIRQMLTREVSWNVGRQERVVRSRGV